MITQMLTAIKFAWNYYNLPTIENEEGQGMAEYALILALIAVILIGALSALQGGIAGAFSGVTAGLPTQGGGD
jgi:pilus assembly protein Flp/PilA